VGFEQGSRLESDESEAPDILLLIVLFLEADDALALNQLNIVPFADPAVSLDFSDREIVLVAETDLVDPVFACLDAYLSDGAALFEHHLLVALVDAGVSGEGRRHAVAQVELHRQNATYLVVGNAL